MHVLIGYVSYYINVYNTYIYIYIKHIYIYIYVSYIYFVYLSFGHLSLEF